jgi:hypothetical protein
VTQRKKGKKPTGVTEVIRLQQNGIRGHLDNEISPPYHRRLYAIQTTTLETTTLEHITLPPLS